MSVNRAGLDGTVSALQEALSRASRRAATAAANLANVDTPGYRAMEVVFDELLDAKGIPLASPEGQPFPAIETPSSGTLREAPAQRVRADGNTVDVDVEMNRLALTQGRFLAAAEMVRKRLALLVYAATDGRS